MPRRWNTSSVARRHKWWSREIKVAFAACIVVLFVMPGQSILQGSSQRATTRTLLPRSEPPKGKSVVSSSSQAISPGSGASQASGTPCLLGRHNWQGSNASACGTGEGHAGTLRDSLFSPLCMCSIGNITVGGGPDGIAYDSAKGEIFVANFDSNNVSAINDTTNRVVATIKVGIGPFGVAYDVGKGEIFVANTQSDNMSVISDATNRVVASIQLGSQPDGVAYDSANSEVYITMGETGNVSVISDTSNSVVATIRVGSEPDGLVYDSGKGEIFVANGVNVSVISDATNKVVTTIGSVDGGGIGGVTYDERQGEIFVNSYGRLTVIWDNNNSAKAIGIGGATCSPDGIAYGGGVLFMGSSNSGCMTMISDTSYTVLASVTNLSAYPTYIVYDDAKGVTYAAGIWSGGYPSFVNYVKWGPVFSTLTASPNKITLGQITYLNVSTLFGQGPYLYTYTGLPKGCATQDSLSLRCTPTGPGDYLVVVYVNDTTGPLATSGVNLTVKPMSATLQISSPEVLLGQSATLNVSVTGGIGTLSYTYTGLPPGCMGANTASLSCTPNTVGSYMIRVYANDTEGNSANSTCDLGVYPPLTLRAWDLPAAGTAPLNVSFTSNVTGGPPDSSDTYLWNFGDQSTSILADPSHIYPLVGVYYVNLTVENAFERGGTGQIRYFDLTVTVCAPGECGKLTATEVATPTTGQAPLSVEFTGSAYGGTPPWKFSWNFGDGGTSTQQSPTHTYTKDGTYQATVTVTDSTGATATNSTTITVGNGGSTPPSSGSGIQLFGLSLSESYALIGGVIAVVAVVSAIAVARGKRKTKASPTNTGSPPRAGPAHDSGPAMPGMDHAPKGSQTPPGVSQPSVGTYSLQPFGVSQPYPSSPQQPSPTPVPRRFCPECGAKNVPTARFCEGCGKGMPPPS